MPWVREVFLDMRTKARDIKEKLITGFYEKKTLFHFKKNTTR